MAHPVGGQERGPGGGDGGSVADGNAGPASPAGPDDDLGCAQPPRQHSPLSCACSPEEFAFSDGASCNAFSKFELRVSEPASSQNLN